MVRLHNSGLLLRSLTLILRVFNFLLKCCDAFCHFPFLFVPTCARTRFGCRMALRRKKLPPIGVCVQSTHRIDTSQARDWTDHLSFDLCPCLCLCRSCSGNSQVFFRSTSIQMFDVPPCHTRSTDREGRVRWRQRVTVQANKREVKDNTPERQEERRRGNYKDEM